MQNQSKRSSKYDLSTGGILNKLLFVALPIIGTQILQMTYNLTDMFWLGRIVDDTIGSAGTVAIAASGTVGMFMWLSMAFQVIGSRGAEIGVSQNFGRNDTETARGIGETSFSLSLIIGLALGAIYVIFCQPLLGFFNIQEPEVYDSAVIYMSIVGAGLPFTFTTAAVSGIFNGSGNSRVPFIVNLIGLSLNMVLDPLLIFTFDMGIMGAAIATVAAQAVAAILIITMLLVSRSRPFEKFRLLRRPQREHTRQIFKWTIPIAVESFLFTFMSMLITRLVTSYGQDALATQRVGSQIESLSWLIAGGFSSALTAFVGQNYGARMWNRIHKGVKATTYALLIWGAFVTLVLFFLGEKIYVIFVPDNPAVLGMGGTYLKILACCQVLACLEGVAAGAFRGIGKTQPPSIVSITCNALRVVAAYLLVLTPLNIYGAWVALSLGAGARGLWIFLWYKKYSKNMPDEDEAPAAIET